MAQGLHNRKTFPVHLNSFIGGEAIDYKLGIANSFLNAQAMDFRQKASQMNVLPGFRTLSANLSDLITVMLQTPEGMRYGCGNLGNFYQIKTDNTIVKKGKLTSNGAAGMAYNQQSDNIYVAGQQTVSIFGQTQSNPQLMLDNFGPSASTAAGVIYIYNSSTLSYDGGTDSNTGLGTARNNINALTASGITPTNYNKIVTNTLTNTYVLPKTPATGQGFAEDTGGFCPFVTDIEPLYGIAVYVANVGSGNLTLTVHDSLNNNLGSATINHSSVIQGWNLFTFASPGIRAIINPIANGTGQGYHFHLTSSSAGDTASVYTIAAGSLQGANMVLFAHRMVQTNNGWHPMVNFNQYLCIGNGQYLSTYNYQQDANPNNSQWVRHQLQTDFGYEITSLSVNNQYLVCAAAKTSTNANRSYQDGYLYIWDGANSYWNQKIEVTMGAPYSVASTNNVTYFYCAGSLIVWGGGQQLIKVRYIGYQNTDYLGTVDHTVVNPNMIDTRYNLLMLAYPSSTTNANLNMGVYSWGAVELTYPNSFGYSYAPCVNGLYLQTASGGNGSSAWSNFQIGMIKNFVDTMYQSWQYTDANSVTHYGLDVLDNTSTPAANYLWESLIWDGGVRFRWKQLQRVRINFLPLPAGTTLNAKYQIDRSGWVTGDPNAPANNPAPYVAAAGDTAITIEVNNARCKEIQVGFFGTCSNGAASAPTITGVTFEVATLDVEQDLAHDPKG